MEIKGTAHCLFEQSGTFKREFLKLGIPALDYDIQDNFGETDSVVDLFAQINRAYEGGASVFDTFTKDDIVLAFFPCIYFCGLSQVMFSWTAKNLAALPYKERMDAILARNEKRAQYYALLNKLCGVALMRGFRLIVENPFEGQTHLRVFLKQPDIVDNNRMERGDYMIKPTAYWFFNCEPEHGFTHQNDKKRVAPMSLRSSAVAGVCSEERSMISPDYARNFIHDFILGRSQPDIDLQLF